jgi:hypothetical protein
VQELNARAALVPATSVEDGLSTTVTRDQVAEALRADGPVELVLDVTRFEGSGEPAETQSVAVSWERPDLERLLSAGSGDTIQLTFDRQAIEDAMSDVEGHGFRERVLVFAVAATVAAGAAGAANAAPMLDQTSSTGASYVVDRDAGSSYSSPGVAGEAAKTPAVVSDSGTVVSDSGASFASPGVAGEAAKTPAVVSDSGTSFSSPAVAGEAAKAPTSAPVIATASDDSGISLDAPGSAAVIGGAIALAITAAAFAVGGQRRRVTPA